MKGAIKDVEAKPALKRSKTLLEHVQAFKKSHYDDAQKFKMYKNFTCFGLAVFAFHKYGDQMAV
jgi:hypothetical protein